MKSTDPDPVLFRSQDSSKSFGICLLGQQLLCSEPTQIKEHQLNVVLSLPEIRQLSLLKNKSYHGKGSFSNNAILLKVLIVSPASSHLKHTRTHTRDPWRVSLSEDFSHKSTKLGSLGMRPYNMSFLQAPQMRSSALKSANHSYKLPASPL